MRKGHRTRLGKAGRGCQADVRMSPELSLMVPVVPSAVQAWGLTGTTEEAPRKTAGAALWRWPRRGGREQVCGPQQSPAVGGGAGSGRRVWAPRAQPGVCTHRREGARVQEADMVRTEGRGRAAQGALGPECSLARTGPSHRAEAVSPSLPPVGRSLATASFVPTVSLLVTEPP